MDGGFGIFDIIIFAGVALFLIMRLGSVLGKRTGHQKPPPDAADLFGGGTGSDRSKAANDADDVDSGGDGNVVHLPHNQRPDTGDQAAFAESDTPLGAGLTAIRDADAHFDPNGFVNGAKAAFEMILTAYADGDEKTLQGLLAPDVFENFSAAIRSRINAGQRLEEVLVGIDSADILEAKMDGKNALVTMKFVSQQAHALYDVDGNVVEGDPNTITTVTDIWTFQRDTRKSDPNWALVATRSSN